MTSIQVIGLILTAMLSENLVLVYCLGISTRVGVHDDPVEARRTGVALTLVTVTTAMVAYNVNIWLTNFGLEHLQLLMYALLIPSVSAVLGVLLRLFLPELSRRLSESVRTATGNAAALGGVLLAAQRGYTLQQTFVYTLFAGIGVTVVLICFAGLSEEVGFDRCPRIFRGLPIRMITAGLMAMTMIGYYGLNFGV